ncbi:MAG: diguanylate cyclase [Planctomycetota bacterium]|nr:MAG: diguanylate cyclase [Planctomycetota bacterium]
MAHLLINNQGEIHLTEILKPVLFIGKNPESDIQVEGPGISPFHCQIKKSGNDFRLVDLNTATGTFVNGIQVEEHLLRHKDAIQLGESGVTIIFQNEEEALREPAETATRLAFSGSHLQLAEDADYSLDLGFESDADEDVGSGFFDITALQRDQVRNFLNLNMPINTSPDLNILLDRIIDSVLGLTSSTSGMFLVRDENFRLVPRCQRNLPQESLSQAIRLILKPVSRKVIETKSLINIEDIEKASFLDLRGQTFPEYQTILGVPLRTMAKEYGVLNQDLAQFHPANRNLGVLLLMRHKGHPPFSEVEIPMIEAVCHQVAVSIFNLKLHLMASADPLTGMYNRNYFQANLKEELDFAKATGIPLSVAIMDVDNFKRFNEFYGAKAGDEVLKSIGRIVLGHVRDIDLVARYGGEKFIFMFLHMNSQKAFEVMEGIRQEIMSFPFLEHGYKIRVSAGVAGYPEHGDRPGQLIERADQALFRAKQTGKNKTVIWKKEKDFASQRTDDLAGLVSGDLAKDYQHMQALMDAIQLSNRAVDPQEQINQLINKVMEVTYTERAMIFQNKGNKIQYILAQDRLGQELYDEIMAPYSMKMVEKVMECKLPMFQVWHPSEEYEDGKNLDSSYSRLIMCAPLRDRERDWGVLYVDSPDIDRPISEADITFFDAIGKQIALSLTQAKLREELQDKERMEHEFNIASSIQKDLLPSSFPELQGIEIFGHTEAAKEVGGDYYDIISTYDEIPRHFLCIGDVSGKGLPAGLVMVMARSALRPLITTGSILSPAELLYHLNQMIYENTSSGVFMSMLLFELLQDGIEYASAGHEHILIFRQNTQTMEAIRSGGVVLGLSSFVPPFENKFLPMEPGDFAVFYTDGATEAQNKEGEEFELQRLLDRCEEYGKRNYNAKEIVENLFHDIKDFFKGVEQHDDITLLVVKRTE